MNHGDNRKTWGWTPWTLEANQVCLQNRLIQDYKVMKSIKLNKTLRWLVQILMVWIKSKNNTSKSASIKYMLYTLSTSIVLNAVCGSLFYIGMRKPTNAIHLQTPIKQCKHVITWKKTIPPKFRNSSTCTIKQEKHRCNKTKWIIMDNHGTCVIRFVALFLIDELSLKQCALF